ncbi:MAG: hypothetical protein J7K81_05360 [Methanophagales archaeon]|nr:hypothetical protein [Methanophagales archaeon]
MEKRFEYEISVDDKVVWKGLNPTKVYDRIRRKYPGKEVAIAWKSNDVPSILGRIDALDRFDANFLKGERVKLQCDM